MKHLKLFITAIILSVLAFYSCNQEEISLENKGRLNVYITDAPFPIDLVGSTFVAIDAVEIRKKVEFEGEEDDSSFIMLAEGLMEINLLELTNGVTELLATSNLDVGTYDEIRLHVVDATVTLKDGSEYNLKIPSGSSSGLKVKIRPAITISEGQTSDVLLDFDLNKSFVVKGNLDKIGGFIFKPVVRGVYMGAAGRIEGNVSDTFGNPIENAWVKLWDPELDDDGELTEFDDDSLIISTFTGSQGNFKLIGLLPGTYVLTTEVAGYKNGLIENISVTAGNVTTATFQLEDENEE